MSNIENNEEVIIEAKPIQNKKNTAKNTTSKMLFGIENLPYTLAIFAIVIRLIGLFIGLCGSYKTMQAFLCITILTIIASVVLVVVNIIKNKSFKLSLLHLLIAFATFICFI